VIKSWPQAPERNTPHLYLNSDFRACSSRVNRGRVQDKSNCCQRYAKVKTAKSFLPSVPIYTAKLKKHLAAFSYSQKLMCIAKHRSRSSCVLKTVGLRIRIFIEALIFMPRFVRVLSVEVTVEVSGFVMV
jgi:hypothetical protein